MSIEFGWRSGLAVAVIVALALAGLYLWRLVRQQREARQRIGAARVRSGHVPLEIPTVRGGLGDAPDTYPQWARQGRHEQEIMVDEQPRIRIRYVDIFGKLAERTIQVDHLDLQRRTIVARSESADEPRIFPLEKIQQARNVETGKPFNLATWVDAVRAARRRRATHDTSNDNYDGPQFV